MLLHIILNIDILINQTINYYLRIIILLLNNILS